MRTPNDSYMKLKSKHNKKAKKLSNKKPQPFFRIRKWQSPARGGALNKHHETKRKKTFQYP